jgi:hypothetical protein
VDVNIYPHPNPAVTAALRSAEIRSIVFEIGEVAHALYVDQVAKRTGRLAASAHVSTEIGGVDHDRWVGVLTVGGDGVDYAATHEFGRQSDVHNLDDTVRTGGHHAAHDLNRVLEELGGL